MSKLIFRTGVFILLGILTMATHAHAQEFSAYFGLGTATNSAGTTSGCASKFIFDNFTGNCEAAPTMGGVFGVFGADYMFSTHLGFNGEYAFRFAQPSYLPAAGINARPAFYDINAIYQPLSPKARIVPVLEGRSWRRENVFIFQPASVRHGHSVQQPKFLTSRAPIIFSCTARWA